MEPGAYGQVPTLASAFLSLARSGDNADAQVCDLMMVLTLGLIFVPFIPGLRDIPRWVPVHRLIWRDYYLRYPRDE